MLLALVALLGFAQFQPAAPVNELQMPSAFQSFAGPAATTRYFNYGQRINFRSPVSGSVLVAQALRSGRTRVPYIYQGPVNPFALTCSPVPCTTPNVQASGGGAPVNETPIAVDPNTASHLLTGGNDYNCSNTQGFYASSNKGTTWNHTCLGNIAGGGGLGDPIVGYDLNHNAFIGGIDGVSSGYDIVLEKSTNNGGSWSSAHLAVTGIAPYTYCDKPWMQIDNTPTSQWPNWIYISTTEFDSSFQNTLIAVAHSTDGGVTFTNVGVDAQVFPSIDQFTDLAIGKDGSVYLTWMRCTANGPTGDCGGTTAMIMFSKSLDGGSTWSAPKLIHKANLAPDTCGAYYGCLPNTSERVSNVPAIDIDRTGGVHSNRLYVTMYNYTGNKMEVLVSRSSNGGSTWSAPVHVSTIAQDQFFPWLTTNKSGVVGVTWLDRRMDPSNINYDAFASTSTDGGVTYTPAVRVSTVTSNPFNDGFGGSFMGDYTGDIWSKNTLFASWTDTRSGIAQDEVGGYKI